MLWQKRVATGLAVAAGLLGAGSVAAQEMPSDYETVLAVLGKDGDFKGVC